MLGSVFLVLAGVLTIAGIALLFNAWRRRPRPRAVPRTAGWIVLTAAAACWIAADGWEFGLIYSVTVPSLVVAACLAINVERRRVRPPAGIRADDQSKPRDRVWARHLMTFALVIPFACVVSLLATVALGLSLPLSDVNRLTFIVCATPAAWGLAAFWVAADPRRLRPVLALLVVAALSYLSIQTMSLP